MYDYQIRDLYLLLYLDLLKSGELKISDYWQIYQFPIAIPITLMRFLVASTKILLC